MQSITKLTQNEFLKWKIPTVQNFPSGLMKMDRMSAEVDRFSEIGIKLDTAKNLMNDIPIKIFESLMSTMDMYRGLKKILRNEYKIPISTNATLKMYEIMTQMHLNDGDQMRLFCNAELPGAFIIAINQYIKTMYPKTDFKWLASSYYPPDNPEMLGDSYGMYACNRDHWLMGPDNSGDLTSAIIVKKLAVEVHKRFALPSTSGATLYTSDAGIDVSSDFNNQEKITSLLNYGQIVCGLMSLAPGGNLVTKQYTFITPFSRSLIALLTNLFVEVYVVKPLTSRPINSEIYIVGKGFKGISRVLVDELLERLYIYKDTDTTPCEWSPLIDPAITKDVDDVLLQISKHLQRQQVSFINEAIKYYRTLHTVGIDKLSRAFYQTSHLCQEIWLTENHIRNINLDQQVQTCLKKMFLCEK